jgi:heptosyltransferase-3
MRDSRIVVFRPGALGDTIVAADAVAAIRARYPESTLELVGNAPAGALLRSTGLVDAVTPFDSLEVSRLFGRTPSVIPRWQGAELVVRWLIEAEPIANAFRAAGAKAVVDGAPLLGALAHSSRADRASPASSPGSKVTHISDFLVATLRPAGISPPRGEPALLKPEWRRPREDGATRVALLHPGSGSPSKNWPTDSVAALAARLRERDWSVRMLCGPADAAAISSARALMSPEYVPVDEPPDIAELADVLASADLYIGNDSGVSHLSARLGVPTVAVFGPTDPRVWAPRGPRVSVVDAHGGWPSIDHVWDAALTVSDERTIE